MTPGDIIKELSFSTSLPLLFFKHNATYKKRRKTKKKTLQKDQPTFAGISNLRPCHTVHFLLQLATNEDPLICEE
jgi:hypothetical protein